MGNTLQMIFVFLFMSFWILFTIATFFTPTINSPEKPARDTNRYAPKPFDWHHPLLSLKRFTAH